MAALPWMDRMRFAAKLNANALMDEHLPDRNEITVREDVDHKIDTLERLATAGGGWSGLFCTPVGEGSVQSGAAPRGERRLWELAFPDGAQHGGGQPLLRVISENEARAKYGDAALDSGQQVQPEVGDDLP